jgi:5,10-methylenetetrahydrofolate reductase
MKRLFYSIIIGIIFLHAAKKLNLFFSSSGIYSLPYYRNYFERIKSLLNSENQVEFLLIKTTT